MSLSSKLVRHITYPVWLMRHGDFDLLRCIKEFDGLQYLSGEELESLQWKRTKGVLMHANQNSPFYSQLFKKNGISMEEIKDLKDFAKLPVISNQDIRANLSSMLAKNLSTKEFLKSNTGGSTGTPLVFYRDKRCLLYRRAIDAVFNHWSGVKIGDWTGRAWGASQDIIEAKSLKIRLYNALFYRTFFLSYDCITPQSIQLFLHQIKTKKPKLVVAFPNMIYQVARYLTDKKIYDVFVPSVACTAEQLFPHQRELIESAFHCEVFERYGSREMGTVASECEHHKGMHVFSPSVYLEILRNGKRAKPGEVGEIVITDLLNYAMPFIRYRIGDMGSLTDRKCECGRRLPLLEKVLGRISDAIVALDGKVLAGQFFVDMVRKGEVPGQVQIIQETIHDLKVKIVREKALNQSHMDYLSRELHTKLGDDVKITFEFVEDIPREASGKYRYVISKVPIKFI